MVILLTTVHVLICVFLIAVVLLQSGKAADLAGAFGGMGSQTVFGPRGSATVLSKATTIAATLFMVTSLTLSIIATKAGGSSTILDKASKPLPTQTKQAAPAPQGPPKSLPITVTPQVEGSAPGKPQTVNAPVQTVPAGQAPTLPPPPGAPAPPSPTK
jgi:preprotein translocase subunit SecG